MFALLLSFPLLCLQAGGPDLPEALAAEPAVIEAWSLSQDSNQEATARNAAIEMVLRRLQTLPADQQLPFLLEADGAGLLNVDLMPIYRKLDQDWELLETRLIESLLQPLPANRDLVRGALRSSSALKSSDIALIEGVSQFLDRTNFAADARHALWKLTGKSFANLAEFEIWWSNSKDLGREIWLERALAASNERELSTWRTQLNNSTDHVNILRGLRHELPEIRTLALAALKVYDFDASPEATQQEISTAFQDALASENLLEQRKALLELVPRLLSGQEALSPILRALKFGHASEKQPAARLLKQIQPSGVAQKGVLDALNGVYPADYEGPAGSVKVRTALWASLSFLYLDSGSNVDEDVLHRLELALEVETNQDVRTQIHSAIGTLAGESFLPVLGAIVVNLDAASLDREESLVAMTTISKRIANTETLQKLLPQLLADPETQMRRQAIESLGLLNMSGWERLLASRLPVEEEEFLQKRMLILLGSKSSPEVLEALLAFQPATALIDPYGSALIAQIANDFATCNRVLDHFEASGQREMAFRVVFNFQTEGLTPEQKTQMDVRYARAVSQYLIESGSQNGNSAYAADAAVRLRERMEAEPTSLEWPHYLVRVQLDRGEVAEAITVMHLLVDHLDFPEHDKWQLGLRTLHSAAALQLIEEGRPLFEKYKAKVEVLLEAAGPESEATVIAEFEFFTYYTQVKKSYPDPEPAPVEETPVPETPVTDNADQVPPAGDGDQETSKMVVGSTQL
ncbi:MAG: hypothetical protein GY747_00060 [Planctomycetes bacterium]|nr:hypothetical protein [Planctomycetota bacterium]MCP4861053.1 hypothetical protein [Planctomycetota bacterium]